MTAATKSGLRVTRKLARGSGASQTFPARRPTTIDDRATILRGHAG